MEDTDLNWRKATYTNGGENCVAALSFVREKQRKLPRLTVVTAGGDALRAHPRGKDRIEYHAPASGRLIINWTE